MRFLWKRPFGSWLLPQSHYVEFRTKPETTIHVGDAHSFFLPAFVRCKTNIPMNITLLDVKSLSSTSRQPWVRKLCFRELAG